MECSPSELRKIETLVRLKILLIAHVDSYFSGFIDLARLLNVSTEFEPTILFPRGYPNLQQHIKLCQVENIKFRVLAESPLDSKRLGSLIRASQWVVAKALSLARRLPGAGYFIQKTLLVGALKKIRRVLTQAQPDLVVLGGDIVGHDMALYVNVGHDLNIPSVVMPGWMASAREPAELNLHNSRFFLNQPLNRLLGRFYPHWKYSHKGRDLVRLPAQEAWALETLGLAPPLPWVLHSGHADKVAVESDAAREYGVAEGLPAHVITVVGSRTHDVLYESLCEADKKRSALCRDLGLRSDLPLVVCALPPDMLYGVGGRPECEFGDYGQLVEFWVKALCAEAGNNVVICLHPSSDKKQVAFVERYGATISSKPVAELIPLCDCYVASISATIQWAIACAKPVINYDVYRYHYTDYEQLSGVVTVEEKTVFQEALALMLHDEQHYRGLVREQTLAANRWGVLDGKAGQRIFSLFRQLAMQRYSSKQHQSVSRSERPS